MPLRSTNKENAVESGISIRNAAGVSRPSSRNSLATKRKLEDDAPSSSQPLVTHSPLASRLGLQPPTEPASVRAKASGPIQMPPSKKVKENPRENSSANSSLLSRMQQNGFKSNRAELPSRSSGMSGFSIKGAASTPSTPKLQQRLDNP